MQCMCVRMYVRRSYQKINRLSRLVLFFYFDSVNNKNNILTTQPPHGNHDNENDSFDNFFLATQN